MRDGDIFHWCWRSDEHHGRYLSYHCRSRIAVLHRGVLTDTYWGWPPTGECRVLSEDQVDLTWVGNHHEMTRITEWQVPYYSPEDVVDLRHSNHSGAPIFLRRGAEKSASAMRNHVIARRDDALRTARIQRQVAERMTDMLDLIEEGRLEDVML